MVTTNIKKQIAPEHSALDMVASLDRQPLPPEMSLTPAVNVTMRGVVYEGVPYQMAVQDWPMPSIQNDTDAIVRITTSALCGSDLHTYHGVSGGATPPWGMGHEAVGYISEVGRGVSSLSVGDYVVIADTPSSGHLDMEPAAGSFFGTGGALSGLQGKSLLILGTLTTLIQIHPLTSCLEQPNTLAFRLPTRA